MQRQEKSANVYRSTSKRKSNSFFSHEKKKPQQQRNEPLASENYLPNTFSLMYA